MHARVMPQSFTSLADLASKAMPAECLLKRLCLTVLAGGWAVLPGCSHYGPNCGPKYADLQPLLAGSKAGPAGTGMSLVTLSNRVDPTWLRPPVDAFTLGP